MDISNLYQDIILDHTRRPRTFRAMENADRTAEGNNPLCGDQLKLWVRLDGEQIADVSFTATGCAISRASASIMTTTVKGKTRAEAESLFEQFHKLVTGAKATDDRALGSMAVFSGVSKFPARVKCASLSWHTLRSALEARPDPISTE
jgi:nitrogen fixation NifU-like protein